MIESVETFPNGKQHVRMLDKGTGVLKADYWRSTTAGEPHRKPKHKDVEFFRVYRTNWLDLIRKKHLTVHEGGFLMFMMAFVKWESNFLVHPDTGANLTISTLAALLGMDRSNASDMAERLYKKGLISIVKRGDGRENNFLLNSNVVFFGKYMRDMAEHNTFDDVEYQPAVRIKYSEPTMKK